MENPLTINALTKLFITVKTDFINWFKFVPIKRNWMHAFKLPS